MRKHRSLTGVALLGVLTAVVVGTVVYYWPQLFSLYEEEMIRAQRIERWSLSSSGQTLPGTPDLKDLSGRLAAKDMALGAPVLVRIFKREFELEVWLKKGDRYERFATYPICMWSGALGPKLKEGDHQSPEGFYTVGSTGLNPNSKYHLSFNLGYPNAYDRAHNRTGSFLMVHGDCRSIGCYAMTDPVIDEIWALVTAALDAGQERFQVQAYPFRMTDKNMAWYGHASEAPFWRQLKKGYDLFERDHLPPQVSVCRGRYSFQPASDQSQRANASATAPIGESCSFPGAES